VITPGRTILDKTVANFTPGHRKSLLAGMDVEPIVITADNFNSAAMRAAMDDPEQVKLFIFTVQALLKPTTEVGRKTRKFQEGLGKAFYEHLHDLDDLIVFADEHHCYYSPAFSEAVRGLSPRAIVGLTATPHRLTPPEQIIFRYPLSLAIAEQLVKTPVLVGRKDDRQDETTKLLDGIRLLQAKTAAIARYGEQRQLQGEDTPEINPVMLVVARDTADADRYERLLSDDGFLGGEYGKHVLVVHSKKPDDALKALDEVEDVSSPVRIIISVGMLKEGWDVKNVYVIASMRASVSDILTEQTLGRGLRLPFGAYTGWELLDTLEVLAHERYEELLRKANVINEAFIDYRTQIATRINAEGKEVQVIETVRVSLDLVPVGEGADPTAVSVDGDDGGITPIVGTVEDRQLQVEAEVAAAQKVLLPKEKMPALRIPQLTMSQVQNSFELADITDHDAFEKLGKQLASTPAEELRRRRLSVHATGDETAAVTTELAVDAIRSSGVVLPLEEARGQLIARVRQAPVITGRPGVGAQLQPLIDAFITGVGADPAAILSAYMGRAVDGFVRLVADEKKRVQSQPKFARVVTLHEFGSERAGRPQVSFDRTGPFKKGVGYEGWAKSLFEQEWFDSSPERDFANLIDGTDAVEFWTHLLINDLPILWSNGGQQYNPDFAVVESGGEHWLAEVKADKDMTTEAVQGKRKAAKRWVQYVNADRKVKDVWHYLLVSETDLRTSKGDWEALKRIAAT
jgi:type III restriction enzyme